MSTIKDADLSLWLHNKLGQIDEHWSSKIVSPHLDKNMIIHASEIFGNLQPHVKIKFLLSLLHMSKRNLEEYKKEILQIINVASKSSDQWCCALAKILKYFPNENVIFDKSLFDIYFPQLLNKINDAILKNEENSTKLNFLIPFESLYMNKSAFNLLIGNLPPSTRYFALKRKPKSAILRAEMLQKAFDANNLSKSKNPMGALIPIKGKNFNKELYESENKNVNSSSLIRINKNLNNKKEIGKIKLLDISEQPLSSKDKRKKRFEDIYLNTSSNILPTYERPSLLNDAENFNNLMPEVQNYGSYEIDSSNFTSTINMSNQGTLGDSMNLSDVMINPSLIKLTAEQIAQAQEIFNDANVVTVPEKTLILAFMSGIQENPCSYQGTVLSIKLSERLEEVALASSTSCEENSSQKLSDNPELSETGVKRATLVAQIFFQMNYVTGEWKRIKTYCTPNVSEAEPTQ